MNGFAALFMTVKNCKQLRLFVPKWIAKQTVVYPYHGIHSAIKCTYYSQSPRWISKEKSQSQMVTVLNCIQVCLNQIWLRYADTEMIVMKEKTDTPRFQETGGTAYQAGPHWKEPGWVRRQKGQGDRTVQSFYCGFHRKAGQAWEAALGLTSLSNFSGPWARGVVPSHLAPDPGLISGMQSDKRLIWGWTLDQLICMSKPCSPLGISKLGRGRPSLGPQKPKMPKPHIVYDYITFMK